MNTTGADDSCVAPLGATTAAYLQLPGGWFRNNAGWIAGRDQTVLVDTCATEARSRRLLEALRRHTADQHAPLIAVLTHAHGDHANGAGLVAQSGGTILASPPAATEIAAGPHTYPSMFRCASWGEIAPPAITDTIDDHRQLDLGDQIVDVVGVPGAQMPTVTWWCGHLATVCSSPGTCCSLALSRWRCLGPWSAGFPPWTGWRSSTPNTWCLATAH